MPSELFRVDTCPFEYAHELHEYGIYSSKAFRFIEKLYQGEIAQLNYEPIDSISPHKFVTMLPHFASKEMRKVLELPTNKRRMKLEMQQYGKECHKSGIHSAYVAHMYELYLKSFLR